MNLIEATYIASRPERDPDRLARDIAREQSLETPSELIPPELADRFLGRVLDVAGSDKQQWRLTIGYPVECAAGNLSALLQLLYGNVSFYPRIRLIELDLPTDLLAGFPGPIAGLNGIRDHVGAHDRPMLLTVLKPRGTPPERLAALAGAFARGGGDILKDDQNIVEADLEDFRARVGLCAQAVVRASQTSGRRCLYLPHVTGSGDELERRLEIVVEVGLRGVVLCPWVMGLEAASRAARDFDLMWLAHPAMAGTWTEPAEHGIGPAVLLGTLARLAGADICIYPGRGGRISSRHADDEQVIRRALTRPMGQLRPTLPCSGGGKTLDQAAAFARTNGLDSALVVGGDLLMHGAELEAATRSAIDALAAGA